MTARPSNGTPPLATSMQIRNKPQAARRTRGLVRRTVLIGCMAALLAVPAFAVVSGTVRNGTNDSPQGGVQVDVVQPGANGMQSLGMVTSGEDGTFEVDVTPQGVALIQSTYNGVTYTQALPPGTPTTNVAVSVFESTNRAPAEMRTEHLILFEPGASTLAISETFFIDNGSAVTYQDAANGTLRFYLPDGVPAEGETLQVTVNSVGVPVQRPAQPAGQPGVFKVDYPAKPGETRYDIRYQVPATAAYTGRVLSNNPPVRLVTPGSVTLSGEGIQSLGQEPQTQARLYTFTGDTYTVEIGGVGAIASNMVSDEETGAPECCEEAPPRVYSQVGWVVALGLGILLLGGTLLFRRGVAA